ncbi:MAG: addiction module protein [Spirulinaceae cyanobacterium]
MSIEQITQAALALPDHLRYQLIDELLASLENTIEPSIQAQWLDEAQQRRNEVVQGQVQPIDGDIALAQVRAILG